jgi:hypothetical protein
MIPTIGTVKTDSFSLKNLQACSTDRISTLGYPEYVLGYDLPADQIIILE